ncbi:EYxxD motif small membrane protein [Thermoflavimicrobium daqui]|jgi:hypothetical protein|nr:EYxxD motif small membrane protein [Thermoflavimicrobium daqui]
MNRNLLYELLGDYSFVIITIIGIIVVSALIINLYRRRRTTRS